MLESIAIDKLIFMNAILGELFFIFSLINAFLDDKINEMKGKKNNG